MATPKKRLLSHACIAGLGAGVDGSVFRDVQGGAGVERSEARQVGRDRWVSPRGSSTRPTTHRLCNTQ
ncbi:hypothetical protein PSEUDO8AS_40128 [Pseudomonas sp. 8AS]|nr:hypothetical protein PSEUDO8AS_40128 [Pseudomonas sp. 8AS]